MGTVEKSGIKPQEKNMMKKINPPCPKCGGKTQKIGTRAYAGDNRLVLIPGKYQVYRCFECGHTFRGELVQPRRT